MAANKETNRPESPENHGKNDEAYNPSAERPEQMEYLSDQQSEEGPWTVTKHRKGTKKQKESESRPENHPEIRKLSQPRSNQHQEGYLVSAQ